MSNNHIYRKLVNSKYQYYYSTSNNPVSTIDLTRISNLKIPPNWSDVQVSTSSRSSIQATGLDSKSRKQYIYHQLHIKRAEEQKFVRLYNFVKSTKQLDSALNKDSKLEHYSYNKVIATMLILVRDLHMRVGKEVYARVNKSYGVSSIRKKHVFIEDDDLIRFRFKGKSNIRLSYTLRDPEIIKHIKLLMKLKGDRLFQYVDQTSKIKPVTDVDLNNYIQKHIGNEFTVKDFRTYSSNFYFIKSLLEETKLKDNNTKKNIVNAIKKSSYYLKHTKAISKKSYILNFMIDMYNDDIEYFINSKNKDPDLVLLDILKKYIRLKLK